MLSFSKHSYPLECNSILDFSVDGRIGQTEVNVNQFFPTLVLSDYEYINKGFADYRIGRDKTAGVIVRYNNALKGTSFL